MRGSPTIGSIAIFWSAELCLGHSPGYVSDRYLLLGSQSCPCTLSTGTLSSACKSSYQCRRYNPPWDVTSPRYLSILLQGFKLNRLHTAAHPSLASTCVLLQLPSCNNEMRYFTLLALDNGCINYLFTSSWQGFFSIKDTAGVYLSSL